ncbi:MAG: DUF1700 domain-containing protein [Clostridiales bacterium]|jgi:uncharacterized membrane protein|nr:DUF1700 domain-containing protein [Clostridiales bacterium]
MLNKTEFMAQLKKHLRKLPFDEIRDAVDYYEQYFFDAGEENEEAVIKELGSPFAVASQIVASFAAKDEGKSTKKGLSTTWMSILALFSSPVTPPLALFVSILAIALVIIMVAAIISLGVVGVSLVLSGIVNIITSIPIAGQNPPTALFFFGLGLSAFGLGSAIVLGTVQISQISFNALAKNMGQFILRRKEK